MLEHEPAAGDAFGAGDFEGGEVFKIAAVDASAGKDVHDVVNEGGRVAFAGDGDVAAALELGPGAGDGVVLPGVIVVVLPVGAAEDVEAVAVGDDGVASALGRRGSGCGRVGLELRPLR